MIRSGFRILQSGLQPCRGTAILHKFSVIFFRNLPLTWKWDKYNVSGNDIQFRSGTEGVVPEGCTAHARPRCSGSRLWRFRQSWSPSPGWTRRRGEWYPLQHNTQHQNDTVSFSNTQTVSLCENTQRRGLGLIYQSTQWLMPLWDPPQKSTTHWQAQIAELLTDSEVPDRWVPHSGRFGSTELQASGNAWLQNNVVRLQLRRNKRLNKIVPVQWVTVADKGIYAFNELTLTENNSVAHRKWLQIDFNILMSFY